jgi:hypothetical protein
MLYGWTFCVPSSREAKGFTMILSAFPGCVIWYFRSVAGDVALL